MLNVFESLYAECRYAECRDAHFLKWIKNIEYFLEDSH
jgi:hypothetical protein